MDPQRASAPSTTPDVTQGTAHPDAAPPYLVSTVARALLAAAVLLSAAVHLELWAGGMRAVDVAGPAFMANAVGGLVIAVAVLLWRHWLPPAAALAFGAATLGAFVTSTTAGGFFGVHETWDGVPQMLSAVSEVAAVVLAVVVLVGERGRRSRLAG